MIYLDIDLVVIVDDDVFDDDNDDLSFFTAIDNIADPKLNINNPTCLTVSLIITY